MRERLPLVYPHSHATPLACHREPAPSQSLTAGHRHGAPEIPLPAPARQCRAVGNMAQIQTAKPCPPIRFGCYQLFLVWDRSLILSLLHIPRKPTYLASKSQIKHKLLPTSGFLLRPPLFSLLLSHGPCTFQGLLGRPFMPPGPCAADGGSQDAKLFYLLNRHPFGARAGQELKRPMGHGSSRATRKISQSLAPAYVCFLAGYPHAGCWTPSLRTRYGSTRVLLSYAKPSAMDVISIISVKLKIWWQSWCVTQSKRKGGSEKGPGSHSKKKLAGDECCYPHHQCCDEQPVPTFCSWCHEDESQRTMTCQSWPDLYLPHCLTDEKMRPRVDNDLSEHCSFAHSFIYSFLQHLWCFYHV